MSAGDICIITLISPCYDEIKVTLHIYKEITTIYDIMVHISNKKLINLLPDEMKFVYLQNVLDPRRLFSSYPITSFGDVITVLKIMIPVSVRDKNAFSTTYSEFLKYSCPDQNSVDILPDVTIVLKFGSSSRNIRIYTPALVDYHSLQGVNNGDMVGNLRSAKDAKKRGFTSWTKENYSQRVYLLELPSKKNGFAFTDYFQLERIRYSSAGVLNMGYNEGDSLSWQRYTNKPPLFCGIKETIEDDLVTGDIIDVLQLSPVNGLEYDTYYAILLSNNVPTVPIQGCEGDFTCYVNGGTTEDHLIAFKTISEVRHREITAAAAAAATAATAATAAAAAATAASAAVSAAAAAAAATAAVIAVNTVPAADTTDSWSE